MKEGEIYCEFGSSFPIGVAHVKVFDGDGNEISEPTCEVCGKLKTMVIGECCFAWLCPGCPNSVNKLTEAECLDKSV
jgi:hypothetical protein